MQFSLLTLLSALTLALADNSVTFLSLDSTPRTVIFTPSVPHAKIPSVKVPGHGKVTVNNIPTGWIGNWYSVSQGKPDVPGMLGEVTFQGYEGMTFFDVSAIVNPADHEGVQEIWPREEEYPVSGCGVWPCNNAYYLWDDVQTKVTRETDLVCTLGRGQAKREAGADAEQRDEDAVERVFVEGGW